MSVGPGGNHLARPYTRSHYRDFWMPTLLDKAPHDRWRTGGATSLKQRVQGRVAELRAQPRAFSLDAAAAATLEHLLGSETARA
jgi:trimethylamine:corrinoid methyltransferase-like protein